MAGKRRNEMNAAARPTASATIPLRFPAMPVGGLAGTSFKHEHLPAILAEGRQCCFFEVHAENYMGAGGPPHRALEAIRRDHPVSLHGVCMSIGGPQPLDRAHLARFRALVERYEPALVRSISRGRRTRRPISTTCCRCRTRRPHSRTCANILTRCRTLSGVGS